MVDHLELILTERFSEDTPIEAWLYLPDTPMDEEVSEILGGERPVSSSDLPSWEGVVKRYSRWLVSRPIGSVRGMQKWERSLTVLRGSIALGRILTWKPVLRTLEEWRCR